MTNLTRHSHHLTLNQVGAGYNQEQALDDISFSLTCAQRMAVIGPNGAGKSTLLHVLAGLKKPSSGTVHWQGRELSKWSREIAFLPQTDVHQRSFPVTVREVVAMGRYPAVRFWKKFSQCDQEKIDEAMQVMEILALADRQIDTLSGGQKQRAFIARCLAQEAHVILLDEPFNGLDAESRTHLSHTLRHLSQHGHLIIATHHNLDTVTNLFDRVLVVNRTQIAFGNAKEVMQKAEVQEVFHCSHFTE